MSLNLSKSDWNSLLSFPVIVAALGYFVDIYDMQLFGIVRIPSLESLGLNAEEVASKGKAILNYQMIGLLIGGILWGVFRRQKRKNFGSFWLYHNVFIGQYCLRTCAANSIYGSNRGL